MLFGDAISRTVGKFYPLGARARKPKDAQSAILAMLTNNELYTPPLANARMLLAMHNTHPWVRSIVSKIGNGVASCDWYVETRVKGKRHRNDQHEAIRWLRAGHRKLRGRQAMRLVAAHIELAGEAFIVVGRSGIENVGKPVAWAVVPPDWVEDVPEYDEGEYVITPKNGTQYRVKSQDVIWIRDPDVTDPYGRGRGITGAAITEIDTDKSASEFLGKFFKNDARPALIVSGTEKDPISDRDRPRLEQTWLERFRGVAKAGRPLFSSKPLEVKELGKGLRDNSVHEIRSQLSAAISEIYSIPPELLGRLENSNRATIDAASYLFGRYTIAPRLVMIWDAIEPFIQANFNLAGGELKYDSPVAEDYERVLKAATARPMAFTHNEIRVAGGLDPVDGMDEYPDDPDSEPDPGAEDDAPEDEAPDDEGSKAEAVQITVSLNVDSGPLRESLDAIKSDVFAAIEAAKAPPPAPEVVKISGMSPEDIVRVSSAHEDPEVSVEATRIAEQVFRALLSEYGADLLAELEAGAAFQVNASVAEWLATEAPELIGHIDRTTRDALRASLVEGVALNEDVAKLASRIDDVFAAAAEIRAPVIGNTMATKITGFGSLEAARQAGFDSKKWLSSQDQKVRSTHGALNGQVRTLSEPFQSPSGARAMHPGAFGEAAEDVGCRCAMRPVLTGEKASNISDSDFEAMHRKAFDRCASEVAATMKKVFAAQNDVARHVFRVLQGSP